MDVGCYCVGGARLLAGEPGRVYGEQVVGASGVDIRFTGTCASAQTSWPSSRRRSPTTRDSKRWAAKERSTAGNPWHCRKGLILVNGRKERVAVGNSFRLELENMSPASRGEAPLLLGREDARGQARAIEALYRSPSGTSP